MILAPRGGARRAARGGEDVGRLLRRLDGEPELPQGVQRPRLLRLRRDDPRRFDAAKLPYDDLLDSFFNAHDARRAASRASTRRSSSRTAARRVGRGGGGAAAGGATIEDGGDYWAAEAPPEVDPPAQARPLHEARAHRRRRAAGGAGGVLNAYAAGRLRSDLAAARAECGVADDVLVSLGCSPPSRRRLKTPSTARRAACCARRDMEPT